MTLEDISAKLDLVLAAIRDGSVARVSEDPEWARLPSAKDRCAVSNFSRSSIVRLIESGAIRSRKVGGARFYSLADIRRHIHTQT